MNARLLGRPGPPGSRGPAGATGAQGVTGQPARVSSLPGSPADGDEINFQNAAMASAGVTWRLKYRSATTDWEFIGGPPMTAEVTTEETTASATYVALTTAGPSLAVPLAGTYDVALSATTHHSAGSTTHMSYDIGGTGASDNDSVHHSNDAADSPGTTMYGSRRKTLTAVTLTSKYRSTGGATGAFGRRRIWLTPVTLDG